MNNIDNYKAKKLLINNIDEIIKNNKEDYRIYYATITFGITHYQIQPYAYAEFFQRFHTLLKNNSTVCNKDKSTRPKILLNPEKSKQLKKGMYTPDHYHGFVMIHKSRLYKWDAKGVDGHYTDIEWKKPCINLKPKFLNCPLNGLMIETVKFFEIKDDNDIKDINNYNLKNFHRSDFSYDDVIMIT